MDADCVDAEEARLPEHHACLALRRCSSIQVQSSADGSKGEAGGEKRKRLKKQLRAVEELLGEALDGGGGGARR